MVYGIIRYQCANYILLHEKKWIISKAMNYMKWNELYIQISEMDEIHLHSYLVLNTCIVEMKRRKKGKTTKTTNSINTTNNHQGGSILSLGAVLHTWAYYTGVTKTFYIFKFTRDIYVFQRQWDDISSIYLSTTNTTLQDKTALHIKCYLSLLTGCSLVIKKK